MAITYHAGRRIQGGGVTSATSSTESSGNATNNGNGFTAVSSGLIGQGYSQASGNYEFANNPVLGNEWSFNFWCKPVAASGNDYFIQFDGADSGASSVFYMYNHSVNGLNLSAIDSTATNINKDASDNEQWLTLTNGSWNMITLVWDNTAKQRRSYKNGVLYSTSKTFSHTSAGNFGTPNRDWVIGNYNGGTGSNYASRATNLDEWSWWSGTLSQADITELYNSGTGIKATELSSSNKLKLMVYYDFEDSVNGTLTNQAPATATVRDVKPTDVQVGSRFEETDTRKMYHYEEQVPDYDYTMTTDPRTNTFERNATYGSITYDSTNDELLMAVDAGSGESTGSMTYIDLGSTLSSEFVLRFENSPTGTPSYNTNAHNVVGISSVAPTTYNAISSTDWIGIRWYFGTQWNTVNKLGIEPRIGENTSSNNHNNSTSVDRLYGRPNSGSNANGRFFHELVWNNGTLTYKVYDNANYTGTVLATAILSSSSNTQWVTGTPSNVTGLRYIVFNNGSDHQYGTYNQILDNIQIWDGVTVPTTGNEWKEEGT